MAKILRLEDGKNSSKLFYVYYSDSTYKAINVFGLSKDKAIALLPDPTPNFVQQVARNAKEAIALVEKTHSEALLSSPIETVNVTIV